jgi:CHASE2 domain-containing sensor protein
MKRPDLKKMLACAWTSSSIGAVLAMTVGAATLLLGFVREPLANVSYDLLFLLRPHIISRDVALVYLDELSQKNLLQNPGAAWDRKLHAQLLERLTYDHARAVVFDIIFDSPGPVPANDTRFARALKANGHVVLAAEAHTDQHQSVVDSGWLELPYEPFRQAAAGWGIVNVQLGSDDGIRTAFPELDNFGGQQQVPTLAWKAAAKAAMPIGPCTIMDRLAGSRV